MTTGCTSKADHRYNLTRRHSYNTKSNKTVAVKTPGGVIKVQYTTKKVKRTICGDCKAPLAGLKALTASERRGAKTRQKKVNRAYGGAVCADCVRQRIVRAFLIEEQKIVKKIESEKK